MVIKNGSDQRGRQPLVEEHCRASAAFVELFRYGFFQLRLQAFDDFAKVRKVLQQLNLLLEFHLTCFGGHFFEFFDLLGGAFFLGCGVDQFLLQTLVFLSWQGRSYLDYSRAFVSYQIWVLALFNFFTQVYSWLWSGLLVLPLLSPRFFSTTKEGLLDSCSFSFFSFFFFGELILIYLGSSAICYKLWRSYFLTGARGASSCSTSWLLSFEFLVIFGCSTALFGFAGTTLASNFLGSGGDALFLKWLSLSCEFSLALSFSWTCTSLCLSNFFSRSFQSRLILSSIWSILFSLSSSEDSTSTLYFAPPLASRSGEPL